MDEGAANLQQQFVQTEMRLSRVEDVLARLPSMELIEAAISNAIRAHTQQQNTRSEPTVITQQLTSGDGTTQSPTVISPPALPAQTLVNAHGAPFPPDQPWIHTPDGKHARAEFRKKAGTDSAPLFDGKEASLAPWVRKVERAAKAAGFANLDFLVRGATAPIISLVPSDCLLVGGHPSWKSFVADLGKSVLGPSWKKRVKHLAKARVQKSGESIRDFVMAIDELLYAAFIDEDAKVREDYLKKVLCENVLAVHRSYAHGLLYAHNRNFKETVQLLQEVEWINIQNSHRPRERLSLNAIVSEEEDLSAENIAAIGNGHCFRCRGPMHPLRECPRARCYLCKEVGHIALDCKTHKVVATGDVSGEPGKGKATQ